MTPSYLSFVSESGHKPPLPSLDKATDMDGLICWDWEFMKFPKIDSKKKSIKRIFKRRLGNIRLLCKIPKVTKERGQDMDNQSMIFLMNAASFAILEFARPKPFRYEFRR